MSKLVLLDGHSLAFRGFYGLPQEMTSPQGELTNAIFGFTSMLLTILSEESPDYIAVAFDKGSTFRHKEFLEYKALRARMPEEMRTQLPRLRELLQAFNIPTFEIENYEADDLLGTLGRQAAQQDVHAMIASGDQDLFQLIGPRLVVRYTPGGPHPKTTIYDEIAFRARFGLEPQQLVDRKALTGDKSDNIPGVAGIGDKTAKSLLDQFGDLDVLYERLDEVKSKRIRNLLVEHKQRVLLNRHLTTIITDLPVTLDLSACIVSEYDRNQVMDLFRELGFRSLVDRLPESELSPTGMTQQLGLFAGDGEVTQKETSSDYSLIESRQALEEAVEAARQADILSVDVETTSTNAVAADLVGLSVAWQEGQGVYIPVGHEEATDDRQLPWQEARALLKPLLEDPDVPKCAHNGEYDLTVLAEAGIDVQALAFDTMLAAWLCDPGSRNLGLKGMTWERLGVEMTPIEDLIGKRGKNQRTMAQVSPEQAAPYAAADVDMTLRLVPILRQQLEDKGQTRLFTDVEMPLVPVLVAMQRAGVLIDVSYLKEMETELSSQSGQLEQSILQEAGYHFNINSTQQLADVLFGSLGISSQGLPRTSTGRISTAAGVLESLQGAHPVIDLILEHRQISKLLSTYVRALPALVNSRTHRIHTSYNQTGSETGRISSSDPNLQNIPIRTEVGRRVRRAFVAPEGWRLLSADYSQVELRVLAHVSHDLALLEAFRQGEDIHASTAARIHHVSMDEVTSEMRRVAKATNFGLMYGQSAFGLAQQTKMAQGEAREFIQKYFEAYPQVKAWLDDLRVQAGQQGYVETLLGRRRYFPELSGQAGGSHNVRQAAERAAINAPIQGTAADIIKIAMIRLHEELRARGARSRLILQVHDELVLEVPEEERVEMVTLVKETMEGAFELDAPLKVDVAVGQNWEQMESVD